MNKQRFFSFPLITDEKNRILFIKAFAATFFWGLFAHGFVFTNMNPSHDSLFEMYANDKVQAVFFSLGRALLPVYHALTASNYFLPWTSGCISLFWIALTCFLIAKMLKLENTCLIAILSGIMVTNRSVYTIFATYFHDAAPYFFSLFLAISAAALWRRFTVSGMYCHLIYGALAMTVSAGIYQSYMAVIVVVIILCSLMDLMDDVAVKQVFINGCWSIAMLLIGCGLYFLIMKAGNMLSGISMRESGMSSFDSIGKMDESILERIFYCYQEAFSHFTYYAFNIYPVKLIALVNAAVFGSGAAMLGILIKQKKMDLPRILLMICLLVLLPFAANVFRMVSFDVHDLMTYGVWLIYLVPLLVGIRIVEKDWTKKISAFVCACLVFLIYSDIKTANLAYVHKDMQSKATLSLVTSVLHDVERVAEYVPGKTPVVFIGDPADIQKELPEHGRIRCLTGLDHISPITYCWQEYFDYILQRDVNVLRIDHGDIPKSVLESKTYPSDGCIQMLDGVIFVHLSNLD